MDGHEDPFFHSFFKRIGPDAARHFRAEHLDAIKLAFGARGFARHDIDLRLSLPLLFTRFYFVLLIGRERRHAPRLERAIGRLGRFGFALLLVILAAVLIVAVIYPVKTLAGIDIFENGGLHDWVIDPLVEQVKRLWR